MHSVLEGDPETITEGKLIKESLNMGHSSFVPSELFAALVKDFRAAERLYGKRLIRLATGHSTEYLARNIKIPEFRNALREKLEGLGRQLESLGYAEEQGQITQRGMELASLLLYLEEVKELTKGQAKRGSYTRKSPQGEEKGGLSSYRKGQGFRELSIRGTLRKAIRRLHKEIAPQDLVAQERLARGEKWLIFLLDASSSMRGEKMDHAKKAGVALAYKALEEGNRIGLVVFSTGVSLRLSPTRHFPTLLWEISRVMPRKETNLAGAIRAASELLPHKGAIRHIIAITDALPTWGELPEEKAVNEAAAARAKGITLSIVGIMLDKAGEAVAKRIVEAGGGKLYAVKQLRELDRLVLTDYYSLK